LGGSLFLNPAFAENSTLNSAVRLHSSSLHTLFQGFFEAGKEIFSLFGMRL
jgi:hypothetical protein